MVGVDARRDRVATALGADVHKWRVEQDLDGVQVSQASGLGWGDTVRKGLGARIKTCIGV